MRRQGYVPQKGNNVMDDREIIEMYWQRDEAAIRETDVKYGRPNPDRPAADAGSPLHVLSNRFFLPYLQKMLLQCGDAADLQRNIAGEI